MKHLLISTAACIALLLSAPGRTQAQLLKGNMKVICDPNVQTDRLGGVDVPSADVLMKMHMNQYILRAADGKLTYKPVLPFWLRPARVRAIQ